MTVPLPTIQILSVTVPVEAICRRLGACGAATPVQRHAVEALLPAIQTALPAKGSYALRTIHWVSEDQVQLEGGDVIQSRNVAKLLQGNDLAWFSAVTVGSRLPDLARQAMAKGDGTNALILDAAGSECVEEAMNWLQAMATRQLLSRRLALDSRRFSVGYGDWALSDQRLYFQMLPMEQMGVRLGPAFLMEPEKTITAIAGVRKIR
jgi:hypothetical protein